MTHTRDIFEEDFGPDQALDPEHVERVEHLVRELGKKASLLKQTATDE